MIIVKIYKALFSGIYFTKALELASKCKYSESMIMLDRSDRYKGDIYSHWLLRGYLLHVNRDFDSCYEVLDTALELIQNRKSLDEDSKKYLALYATDLLNSSIVHGGLGEELREVDTSFVLENVESRLKRYFPILLERKSELGCKDV